MILSGECGQVWIAEQKKSTAVDYFLFYMELWIGPR